MAFWNPNEAFGLPKGTVRALLALVLVGALIAAIFMDVGSEYIAILSGLAGAAVAFYFSKRGTEEAVDEED